MPGVSLRKTSFSARSCTATAAAAVSALTLSQPVGVGLFQRQRGDDRHDAAGAEGADQLGIDARDRADVAEVDRLAAVAGQRQALAEEHRQRMRVQADGAAAELCGSARRCRR